MCSTTHSAQTGAGRRGPGAGGQAWTFGALNGNIGEMRVREAAALVRIRRPELHPVARRLAACYDIEDLRLAGRRSVPRAVFDYVDGGADEEISMRENIRAFRDCWFVPRVLAGAGSVDTSARVLGSEMSVPLALAPTGCTRMMHPDGEIAVARAARRHGVPYTVSTMSNTTIEDIRRAVGDADLWFQLYVQRDAGLTKDLVNRAEAAGCGVLMLTVDTPVPGYRIRDERNGLAIPPQLTLNALAGIAIRPGYWLRMLTRPAFDFANLGGPGVRTIAQSGMLFEPDLTWDTLAELRERWAGTLLVKGPLGPQDARRAIAAGANGIVLSNHGGRQLDRVAPPIKLLPWVRDELGPSVPLLVDSGVRHGADVALALALGADAAMIGRAYLYGLMAGGEPGVDRVLELLAAQFTRTLCLAGVASVAELKTIRPELIQHDK
jgi:L-lactate dehydrogenase (cytochrome)